MNNKELNESLRQSYIKMTEGTHTLYTLGCERDEILEAIYQEYVALNVRYRNYIHDIKED